MDLRTYYQTIRRIEGEIREDPVVMVSLADAAGGRAGVLTDVPRSLAARLIAEGKAELASPESATEFRAGVEARWRAAHGWAGDTPPVPAVRSSVKE